MNSQYIGQPHGNPSFCGLTIVALIILLSSLCAIAAPAQEVAASLQPYVWKNVTVKGGGFICDVVFNATQPNLVYCRTDIGSSYKWDNQAKKWIPLTDWCGIGNLHGSESIATDPIDPQRVYIAAGMGQGQPAAILRSMDQGKTFQVVDVPFRMGGNENGRGVGERLAIDPNDNNILYFGSRSAGLWISKDAALTWSKVNDFPPASASDAEAGATATATGGTAAGAGRGRGAGGGRGGAGLSFVAFDPSTGTRGKPTQTIYVGSTERGDNHLFRSTDAGQTWQPVPGQPANFLPIHAAFDSRGILYVVYGNGVGPNGVTDGAVWKFNPKDGAWMDITPVKDTNRFPGGYGGIGVDRQHSGTVVVASLDRKNPNLPPREDDDDRIYRTTDGGQTWADISPKSHRDASASPYVAWTGVYDGNAETPESSVGWWIDALAIDPFDSRHVCYATGATIWNMVDMNNADSGADTHWTIWADGIEETAILNLISPTAGAHLISGFGDISGFTHDDLDVSPPQGPNRHPLFANNSWLDFAEKNPSVVVRVGSNPFHPPDEGTMAYSLDGGHTWKPFTIGAQPAAGGGRGGFGGGGGRVILSADGSVFMSTGGTPKISTDNGATWKDATGLPAGISPIADRFNPAKFYALDPAAHQMYLSTDGGATFTNAYQVTGLPAIESSGGRGGRGGSRLVAVGGREGDLWMVGQALCHSSDDGRTFQVIPNHPPIGQLSFGKAAPGKDYPAIFVANGDQSGGPLAGIYRSDDEGATWVRVNDAQHQWGNRFDCLSGDPRIYGRVYVGTNGRGILYGDIAN
jgi:xyloglucan-specific exo-beta-1,4-glucanase